MARKSLLDSKDWDEMTGDELARFCQGWQKNAYNLSAMTSRVGSRFVTRNSGKVCVRYAK
jgi:hypothetical protein